MVWHQLSDSGCFVVLLLCNTFVPEKLIIFTHSMARFYVPFVQWSVRVKLSACCLELDQEAKTLPGATNPRT